MSSWVPMTTARILKTNRSRSNGGLDGRRLDHTQAGLGDGAAAEELQPVLQVGVGQEWIRRGATPWGLARHHCFSWNTPTYTVPWR
jgi:hypothetical protein